MTTAVNTFLKDAEAWLQDEDAPAVASLQAMAAKLDEEMTPALLGQYGLTYRSLLKRKPPATPAEDELTILLREASEASESAN